MTEPNQKNDPNTDADQQQTDNRQSVPTEQTQDTGSNAEQQTGTGADTSTGGTPK